VAIREGLVEGDQVVLNPMALVEEGQDDTKEAGPEGGADAADGDVQEVDESPSDQPAADGP
jgi:hypothetical protein